MKERGQNSNLTRALDACWFTFTLWENINKRLSHLGSRAHVFKAQGRSLLAEEILKKLGEEEEIYEARTSDFCECVEKHRDLIGEELSNAFRGYYNSVEMLLSAISHLDPNLEIYRTTARQTRVELLECLKNRGYSFVKGSFQEKPNVELPRLEDKLWRYLNVYKFQDLVTSGTLYLHRIDLLQDKFEGSLSNSAAKQVSELRRQLNTPDLLDQTIDSSHIQGQMSARELYRRFFYVNCWHRSEYESVAMWNLYLYGQPGVAIQTTFEQLMGVLLLGDNCRLDLGCVRYLNFNEDWFDALGPIDSFFHKRVEYQYESEFRILHHYFPPGFYQERARLILNMSSNIEGISVRIHPGSRNFDVGMPEGIWIPIEPERLLQRVIIHPGARPEFRAWVRSLVADVSDYIIVENSTLDSQPKY